MSIGRFIDRSALSAGSCPIAEDPASVSCFADKRFGVLSFPYLGGSLVLHEEMEAKGYMKSSTFRQHVTLLVAGGG